MSDERETYDVLDCLCISSNWQILLTYWNIDSLDKIDSVFLEAIIGSCTGIYSIILSRYGKNEDFT